MRQFISYKRAIAAAYPSPNKEDKVDGIQSRICIQIQVVVVHIHIDVRT